MKAQKYDRIYQAGFEDGKQHAIAQITMEALHTPTTSTDEAAPLLERALEIMRSERTELVYGEEQRCMAIAITNAETAHLWYTQSVAHSHHRRERE